MAMTASVKDELSRLAVTKPCCRRAEVAALLRFAGTKGQKLSFAATGFHAE